MQSISYLAKSASANPTDLGILAVALRALADFAPALVPAGKDSPSCVVSTCPVCVGEPGSLGSLRVEAVDMPVRLSWHCSLHNGGFSGVSYALSKHQAEKVSTLRHVSTSVCSKVDILPDRDPLPDHQADLRCTDPRRIVHYSESLGRSRLGPFPCKKCLACRGWRKARRISDLKSRVEDWATVRRTSPLAAGPYAAMSRRLRRHGCDFAAVPVDAGRVILTNSTVEGDALEAADVFPAIENLVGMMVDGGRISGTRGTRKARQHKEVQWKRMGTTKPKRPRASGCINASVVPASSIHGIMQDEDARLSGT